MFFGRPLTDGISHWYPDGASLWRLRTTFSVIFDVPLSLPVLTFTSSVPVLPLTRPVSTTLTPLTSTLPVVEGYVLVSPVFVTVEPGTESL